MRGTAGLPSGCEVSVTTASLDTCPSYLIGIDGIKYLSHKPWKTGIARD
ncbi:hypothetical protein I553_0026 [Mycobacterium xenopi 4042]|uniref:Uncharacterized protein n=1 Tax=Mycobacterium xenopi 4042 TaxID=1299334 RepID=X8CTZ6_MYCXE|nr:hypothetical protein I553_0026 [Mycobacterium xenopi 4042]